MKFGLTQRNGRDIVEIPRGVVVEHPRSDLRAYPADAGDNAELGIADILAVLRRRKWIIFACAAAFALAAVGFGLAATPQYTAEGLLLLATPKSQVTDAKAVIADLPLEAATVRSEIEVLKSSTMADKVTQKLELWNEPAYLRRSPNLWTWLGLPEFTVADVLAWAGLPAEHDGGSQEPNSFRRQIAESLATNIEAVFDGRSYVVRLRFTSSDPVLAAKVINSYMEIASADVLAAKTEATRRAAAWLRDRLGELKIQVQAADQAIEKWRVENKISENSRGESVPSQQSSELNSQLVVATVERAQREANLRQVQGMINSPSGVASAGQVLGSPVLQRLTEQEAEIQRRVADEGAVYGERHPSMMKLSSQRDEMRRKIKVEVDKVVANLSHEVAIAQARESQLRAQLDRAQKDATALGSAEIRLKELRHQADVTRRMYETYLTREMEISGQDEIASSDARIVSEAKPPLRPSYPRKTILALLAAGAGLVIGAFIAFLTDRLERGFREMREVNEDTGLRPLGFVPVVRRPERAFAHLTEHPRSSFSEAVRALRTSLLDSRDTGGKGEVLLVTSSLPAEGKSLIAAALARSAAAAGKRVLLVDSDLRKPTVGKLMRDKNGPGLVDILDGSVAIKDAIRSDTASGMDYVSCWATKVVGSPQDLLGSREMRGFIEQARGRYDLVVLDAPPVLAISDARVLVRYCDVVLFVIRWRVTPRQVVRNALELLVSDGGPIMAAVLSRVDVRKQAKLGLHDTAAYHARYGATYFR